MATKFAEPKAPNIDLRMIDRDFIDESFIRVTDPTLKLGKDVQLLVDAEEM